MLEHGISLVNIDVVAEALFKKWIRRLKLQDWEIVWKIVRKSELPESKSGQCDTVVPKKIARISVLHPEDADPRWITPYDFELTIVHELLHPHLAPWQLLYDLGDQSELLLEQAVHALSKSFLEADRQEGSWKQTSPK